MKTYTEIKATENFFENLSKCLSFRVINEGECLMIHKNSNDFAVVKPEKVSAKTFQGYTEYMSAENLTTIVGLGETTDDGIVEANKVVVWMDAQK